MLSWITRVTQFCQPPVFSIAKVARTGPVMESRRATTVRTSSIQFGRWMMACSRIRTGMRLETHVIQLVVWTSRCFRGAPYRWPWLSAVEPDGFCADGAAHAILIGALDLAGRGGHVEFPLPQVEQVQSIWSTQQQSPRNQQQLRGLRTGSGGALQPGTCTGRGAAALRRLAAGVTIFIPTPGPIVVLSSQSRRVNRGRLGREPRPE